MKSTRDVRGKAVNFDSGDLLKKAIKLEPIKKSGKEKHALYGGIEDDELSLDSYKKRESVLDYFDDVEDDDMKDVDDDIDDDLDDDLDDEFDEELYDDDQEDELEQA